MKNGVLVVACASLALGGFGCSSTVRHMTATHWTTTSGGAVAAAEPAAPAARASNEPGAPGATAAEGPSAEAAAAPRSRVFYLTYWEGSCSSGAAGFGRGCSKGDSQVKRCSVRPDNSLACVDEKDMGKALATE